MRKNALNVVVFMFLAGSMYFLWQHADKNWLPKPAKKEDPAAKLKQEFDRKLEEDVARVAEAAATRQARIAGLGGPAVAAAELPPPKLPEPPKVSPPPADALTFASAGVVFGVTDYLGGVASRPTLVALGDGTFYNRVLLTTRGGGVQQVALPRFEQADRLGRPVKDAAGNPVPLFVVPGVVRTRGKQLREDYVVPDLQPGKVTDTTDLAEPSYTIFHYPTPDAKYPDPYLGEVNWDKVLEEHPEGGPHKVVFETVLRERNGIAYYLKFRKTYTLSPTDYHVGLRLDIEKLNEPGAAKGKGQLRYQLSGPHGVPIEGEWYTSTYRVGIVGWKDKTGTPRRQYEDSASITAKRGGEAVTRGDNSFKYMVVANQFFASGVAIDDTAEGAAKNPWAYVRATAELPFDQKQDPNQTHFDDITVRAASETLDLEPGKAVAHSYLIYSGPSKVGLLKLMPPDRGAVSTELVDRYKDALTLSTITDFRSETWIGRFASSIYWTDLVIAMTNLMHLLLALIHRVIQHWALSIVVLTVCVRLVLLLPSRKQTAMSMKMMEVQKQLQPEFEKLQEKYKDDMGGYNREKTRLMMKHGANPFAMMGGCLLLFAQMPIMMGLYFCLQESVFFRLDSFLWVQNLAAPDMLVWWGEGIPYISTPDDVGSFLYLGPYFNLLPLLAVGLMLYQQSKMMPQTTDPQAEQQRMMMKLMMGMMALFFYKVAAGLALYFIVSTGWAIIERQFIPKPKIDGLTPPGGGDKPGAAAGASANGKPLSVADAAVAEAQKKHKGFFTRLREQLQAKMEDMQRKADEQSKRQIRNDPNRPASDGPTAPPPIGGLGANGQANDPRRDKKKRKK